MRVIEPLQHLLAGVRRVLCASASGHCAAGSPGKGHIDAGTFNLLGTEEMGGGAGAAVVGLLGLPCLFCGGRRQLSHAFLPPSAAADDDSSATAALRERFASLRRRLAEANLEDFQIDGSCGEQGCSFRALL